MAITRLRTKIHVTKILIFRRRNRRRNAISALMEKKPRQLEAICQEMETQVRQMRARQNEKKSEKSQRDFERKNKADRKPLPAGEQGTALMQNYEQRELGNLSFA